MHKLHLFAIVCATIVTFSFGQECKVTPKCTCTFGDETVDVEEQNTGSEALAGAVGALGSLMVSGGGFGLWYLIKGRKMSVGLDRSDSTMSNEQAEAQREDQKAKPPPYSDKKTPNIYSAGKNDNVNHRVGKPMDAF